MDEKFCNQLVDGWKICNLPLNGWKAHNWCMFRWSIQGKKKEEGRRVMYCEWWNEDQFWRPKNLWMVGYGMDWGIGESP